jgi:MFS family permease
MGRRPVLLLATLLMTLCSVWCAEAKTFGSLLAARALQGAGAGASEMVAPALIGDLFFIHQRGRAMVGKQIPRVVWVR